MDCVGATRGSPQKLIQRCIMCQGFRGMSVPDGWQTD